MHKIHFYKVKSRLGIVNPILNTKDLNIGVEDAPDEVLTKEFLSKFDNPQISEFAFSKPEALTVRDSSPVGRRAQNDIPIRYFDLLARELSLFKNLINKTLERRETQVVVGGDNSITFSSLLALLDRVKDPSKVGYIQFDSHGEMNLYKTSPSKNFHGMYLRPFLDSFDIPKINTLVPQKLIPQNTLFIGALDLDKEEKVFFNKMGFKNIDRSDVLDSLDLVLKELKEFVSRFDYVHVNFDIDVFNKKEVLATGIPSNKGFMYSELLPLIEIVSKHPNLSLDLSEVNPQKEGRDKTIKIAKRVLSTILL